jgi:hypothetical protein
VKKGRPPLGDDRMISISIRLPTSLYEQYKQARRPSALMRKALEAYTLTEEFKKDYPS